MATKDTSLQVIDLSTESLQTGWGSTIVWQEQTLVESTILQCMAFDYKGKETDPIIYVMQCKGGSTDGGKECGDMVLNKLKSDATQYTTGSTGHQLLHTHDATLPTKQIEDEWSYKYMTDYEPNGIGFGHGTQIGIEYAPDGTYLWFDHGSLVINRGVADTSARWDVVGIRACRVKYVDGKISHPSSSEIQQVSNTKLALPDGAMYTGSSYHTISIDNVNKLLAVKYVDETDPDRQMKLAVYSFSYNSAYTTTPTPSNMTFTKLATIDVPRMGFWLARVDGTCSSKQRQLVPNGWAIFGDYLYLGYGTAYWTSLASLAPGNHTAGQWEFFSPDSYSPGDTYYDGTTIDHVGNTLLRRVNWKTGVIEQEFHTEAAKSLTHRELEGMSIIPFTDATGAVTKLQLHFAFAGGATGDRNFSMMYKETTL
jgi:hypothetical protein